MPAPTEQSTSLSPGWRLFSTSTMARGMLALEVFPTCSTFRKNRSKPTPLRLAAAFRMRPLAWCGMIQRVSSALQPLLARAWRMMVVKLSVAKRNSAWPSIRIQGSMSHVPVADHVARLLAAGHVQAAGVGAEHHLMDAMPRAARRNDRRPGAVAEQEVRAAVRFVQQLRLHVDAHGQHVVRRAGKDHPLGRRHRVEPAGAGRVQIERGNRLQVQAVLQDRGGRGHGHVGRRRGDDHGVDVLGGDARAADRLQRRLVGHARGLLVRRRPSAAGGCR